MNKSLALRILTSTFIIIVLALGIVFVPNLPLFDETELPEIAQLLANPVDTNIEGNAYFYLYGMSAASDKDPEQVGKAVIKTLQSKHQQGDMATLTDAETIALYGAKENGDDEWQAIASTHCTARTRSDCFERLLAELDGKQFTQVRLLVQMKRYQNVIRMPHMIEDMSRLDATSPLPNFFLIMKMGEFSQAKAYQESGLDGLIVSSQADMKFWRMALNDSQTLIGKMVSIASLRRNLAALSYGIKNASAITPDQAQQLKTLLTPLSQEEISMEKKLISELRYSVENWQTAPKKIPEGESVFLWLLTQPMANTNWFYRQTLKPALALDKMSPTEFYERAQVPNKPLEFSRFNPYNLGGKIFQSKNWQYSAYIGRAYDLANIYSLINLQVELKINPSQNAANAIKTSTYKNAYTQKSFDYDSASKELSFTCFDVKDICKITL